MLSKRHSLQRFVFGLGGLGLATHGSAASLAALPGPLAASWVHGHGTDIGFPDLIESATSNGGSKVLRGRSFSDNCLHYALNVPAGKTRAQAILLRFRTLPGAELRSLRVFDGEREVAVLADLRLQQGDWGERRIALPQLQRITRGLGVTLGISFGGVDREFAISALGAEFIAYEGETTWPIFRSFSPRCYDSKAATATTGSIPAALPTWESPCRFSGNTRPPAGNTPDAGRLARP